MTFRTRWAPARVADALEGIIDKTGYRNFNIHDKVTASPDGRGGYRINATSTRSSRHNTGLVLRVREDQERGGSVVTCEQDHKIPYSEAKSVEESLKKEYFKH